MAHLWHRIVCNQFSEELQGDRQPSRIGCWSSQCMARAEERCKEQLCCTKNDLEHVIPHASCNGCPQLTLRISAVRHAAISWSSFIEGLPRWDNPSKNSKEMSILRLTFFLCIHGQRWQPSGSTGQPDPVGNYSLTWCRSRTLLGFRLCRCDVINMVFM